MGKNKVLFVDDEINVISAIRRGVADEPYKALFANSAQEALIIMEEQNVDVIVTDMRMPGMDGLTLLKITKEKYPRTVRVVLSGYTQLSQMLATINQGEIFKFITKPWTTDEELLPAVRQAIEYYNLQVERDTLRDNLAQRNIAYQNILQAMDQKMAEEKAEFARVKEISGWLFSLWKKQLSFSSKAVVPPEQMGEFVNVAEEVYLTYLSQLPTMVDVKSVSNLINDIVKSCNNQLRINHLSKAEFKTRGNHKFLLLIFKVMTYYLTANKYRLLYDLAEERKEKNKLNLIFSAEVNTINPDVDRKLKIACDVLDKIGESYDITISWGHSVGQQNRIQVRWATEIG